MISDACIRQAVGAQSSSLQGKHLGVPHLREALGIGIYFKNKVTSKLKSSFWHFQLWKDKPALFFF